jgi:prefoldin subunit 4
VEVVAEDQERINAFSRLHMKMTELELKLKAHKVCAYALMVQK